MRFLLLTLYVLSPGGTKFFYGNRVKVCANINSKLIIVFPYTEVCTTEGSRKHNQNVSSECIPVISSKNLLPTI